MDIATTVCAGVEVTMVTTFGLAELAGLLLGLPLMVDIIPAGPVMIVKVTTAAPGIVV